MPLHPDAVDGFVNKTIPYYERMKWTDISLEFPRYLASQIMTDKKIKRRGTHEIRFNVQTGLSNNVDSSGLFDTDGDTNVEDVDDQAVLNWYSDKAHWVYDIGEPLFQSDRETIVGVLAERRHDMYNSIAEFRETHLWSAPTSTAEAKRQPYGIPFWMQKDATTTPEGAFNGGNPTGFSAGAAGISSTDVPNWSNWTFGWSSVTPDDLIRKIKNAMWETDFAPVHDFNELKYGGDECVIYTTRYDVAEPLERLAETRNDNLGPELAKYQGKVMIGGCPIVASHYLTANDTTGPLYGVNWSVLRPYCHRNWDMRETKKHAPNQRNVRQCWYDTWYNWGCINRRKLWVGSKS